MAVDGEFDGRTVVLVAGPRVHGTNPPAADCRKTSFHKGELTENRGRPHAYTSTWATPPTPGHAGKFPLPPHATKDPRE